MAYLQDLQDLIELAQAGADPMSVFSQFGALKDERQARIQERKQAEAEARAGALDSLMGYAFQAAGEPSNLKQVLRMAGAEQAFGAGDPAGALDALFYPAGGRNAGLSRIDPTLPAEAETDIAQIVRDEYQDAQQRGEMVTPDQLRQVVQGALGYGPNVYGRLQPEVEPLIEQALKAARGF